jgi:hypothetical protein
LNLFSDSSTSSESSDSPSSEGSGSSENNGSAGDPNREDGSAGDPNREDGAPDMEDATDTHHTISECPHNSFTPFPDDSSEARQNTLCDMNPTRSPDGILEQHNAFRNGDYAFTCTRCHGVMCFECLNR